MNEKFSFFIFLLHRIDYRLRPLISPAPTANRKTMIRRTLTLARPLASAAAKASRTGDVAAFSTFASSSSQPLSVHINNSLNGNHPRHLHPTTSNLEGDLDDLCKKHIELPQDEFAKGCSFLQQVALGNLHEVKRIIQELGAINIVNFRDYDRRSPLHLAASEGHLEMVKYLLEQGARINRSDRWGNSPIDDAYRHKHFDVMEYLRGHGGTFGSTSQSTNFLAAVYEGDLHEIQTLYELGSVDLNAGEYVHLIFTIGQVSIANISCLLHRRLRQEDCIAFCFTYWECRCRAILMRFWSERQCCR